MNKLKFIKSTLVITLGAVLLGSCMKSEDPAPPPPMALVGIFNAYSPIQGVRVRADEALLGELSYGGYSDLLAWTNLGQQKLTFLHRDASVNTIISEQSIIVEEDKLYTAFVYGTEDDAKFLLTEEEVSNQTDAQPKVRFLNLANGTGEVDVFFGDDQVTEFSYRDQETTSSAITSKQFVTSDKTGATNIVIKDAEGNEVAKINNYDLRGSTYYTIVLVGNPGDEADEEDKGTYEIKTYFWR